MADLDAQLRAFEGRPAGPPTPGLDPVNATMIRHFCEVVGDRNPIYTDEAYAASSPHGGIVAPPTMLQVWSMRGLAPGVANPATPGLPQSPFAELLALLDAAGYVGVAATNCEQEYDRYLRPGDRITTENVIERISEEKRTALGVGRFVDTRITYRDARGERVGSQLFRILKFKPGAPPAAAARAEAATEAPAQPAEPRAPWPRPAISEDTAFFWEGVAAGELRIQYCSACSRLRHPPRPMCPHCQSLDWEFVRAQGGGHVYSFVVSCHPAYPPFEYPIVQALVELDEGTRYLAILKGVDPDDVAIGMRVRISVEEVEPGFRLPIFRPAPDAGGAGGAR